MRTRQRRRGTGTVSPIPSQLIPDTRAPAPAPRCHHMATNVQMQQPPQVPISPHPDHITQVKILVQQLKESLSNLMRIASANINHNAQIDTGSKTVEGKFKFDKALEDFFAITNQIERHLRTIADCAVQLRESQKYMPFQVSSKLDATGPVEISMPNEVTTISYNQYISIIRNQKNYIQSLQEILMEGARKISHSEVPSAAPSAATSSSAAPAAPSTS